VLGAQTFTPWPLSHDEPESRTVALACAGPCIPIMDATTRIGRSRRLRSQPTLFGLMEFFNVLTLSSAVAPEFPLVSVENAKIIIRIISWRYNHLFGYLH
jgi:hypothetical protein